LVSESSRSPSPSSFLHSPLTPPQQQQDEMALLDATKSKLIQNSLRSHRRYEFHVEESLSAKGSVDVEESLSDFKHLTAAAQRQEGQPRQESYSVDRTFDSTKRLIDQALERNEDSLHEFLLNDQLSHSHLSSLSTLSPRDGHIHFRKIQKRMKEVRCCSCCLLGSPPPLSQVQRTVEAQHFFRHRSVPSPASSALTLPGGLSLSSRISRGAVPSSPALSLPHHHQPTQPASLPPESARRHRQLPLGGKGAEPGHLLPAHR
jgi:hypothetical protein